MNQKKSAKTAEDIGPPKPKEVPLDHCIAPLHLCEIGQVLVPKEQNIHEGSREDRKAFDKAKQASDSPNF